MCARRAWLALLCAAAWTLLVGCSSEEDGIEVVVRGGLLAAEFVTDGGYRVTLDRAALGVKGVRLESCGRVATRLLRSLRPIPSAHAHVGHADPEAVLIDLLAPELRLGRVAPQPGRYCAALLSLAEAAHGDGSVTLHLEGSYRHEERGTSGNLSAAIGDHFDVLVPIAPLDLRGAGDHVVAIAIDGAALFAGIDLEGPASERDAALAANVHEAFRAVPQAPP